ncbi:MAG: M48 family metalloprotease [Candidatus Melainabacteria bacterium]|nr:M48 family metalloprotease [Candidatus Melainabacteria bacterium]
MEHRGQRRLLPVSCLVAVLLYLTASTSGIPALAQGASVRQPSGSKVIEKLDGASRFISLPPAEEERIGKEMNAEILKTQKVSASRSLTGYVSGVGARLAAQAGGTRALTFTVLDDNETVNAFAIPGGFIYITTGMLRRLDSEGELAAVLSHEIGHITENHISARLRNLTGTRLLVGLLGKLTGRDLTGSHVVKIGKYLLMQKFSRGHEYDADIAGVDLMTKAGYDPRCMVTLQEKLYELSRGRLNIEFLNSHPSSAKRAREVDEYIRANGLSKPGLRVDAARYLEMRPR